MARAASGQAVAAEDRALLQLTVIRLVANPALRRRLVPLLAMSVITIIGYWGAVTWIPQYAGRIAAAAGRDARDWISPTGIASGLGAIAGSLEFVVLADAWGRKPAIWVYYLRSFLGPCRPSGCRSFSSAIPRSSCSPWP
jgi:hypothetical protein